MGIISRLREEQRASVDLKNPRDPGVAAFFGGTQSASGKIVTSETALRNGSVYAAVRVVSEGLAMLPLILFEQIDARTKNKAINHPLYDVLKTRPNSWQTSFEFREMMQGHILLRGNAYAYKIINNRGYVEELMPLHPDRVRPFWVNKENSVRAYQFTPASGAAITLLDNEVFHVAGLGFDGLMGANPIKYNQETIGIALAQDEYGARFYANDATPPGILTHPGHFADTNSRKAFAEQWRAAQSGDNRHKTAVLEDGMTYEKIALTPKESQFLEGRKFSVTEIARMFKVPPHLIGDLTKSSFSNITQQSLEFIIYTLMPWFVRWEQAIQRDLLLTKAEQSRYFAKHNVDSLLRGDLSARYTAYHLGIADGHITRNEVRELEERNPIDGLDDPLVPMNMAPAGQETPVNETNSRLIRMIEASADRLCRKELNSIEAAIKKNEKQADLITWVRDFYNKHSAFVATTLAISNTDAEYYTKNSCNGLIAAVKENNFDKINQWQESRMNELIALGHMAYRDTQAPIINLFNDIQNPQNIINNELRAPDVKIENIIESRDTIVAAPDVVVNNIVEAPIVNVEVPETNVNIVNEVLTPEVNVTVESPGKVATISKDLDGNLTAIDITNKASTTH